MPIEAAQTDLPITAHESQALVDRIASGVALRRAARLRAFLLFVSEQTLHRGVTVLHEHEIGVAVFGRSPGYDTGIDNIVRVNATELRKRLEHYFAEEGAQEQLVLEIQRGSYTPVFRRRIRVPAGSAPFQESGKGLPAERAPEPPAELISVPAGHEKETSGPLQVTITSDTAPNRRVLGWQIAAALLFLLAACLGWQLHRADLTAQRMAEQNSEAWRRNPALHAFWQGFFDSGTASTLLLADTSFAIAQDIMQRPISLTDYLDYRYKQFAEDPALSSAQRRDLMLVLERNTGSDADFRVGQQILALNPSDPAHLTLKFAREYTPEAAKRNNLILIGSRQSNPWVSLFSDKLNFDLTYDSAHNWPLIVNRAPRPGEPSTYPLVAGSSDGTGTGYAVIAFLPGMSENTKILMIEGTDSQATGAAGDYITDEQSMKALEERFQPGKILYFELVLRTSQLNGTPLHSEVIALRTYGAAR
jgi:hypothetical protein